MSMKLYRYILFQVFNKIYDLLSRNYLITYSLYQKCLYDVRLISKPHIFIWEKNFGLEDTFFRRNPIGECRDLIKTENKKQKLLTAFSDLSRSKVID